MVASLDAAKSPAAASVKRSSPVLPLPEGQKRARQDETPSARDEEQPIAISKTPEAQRTAVMKALQDEALESPGIPMVARRMLADGARPWLGNVTREGLHELQNRVLSQIQETFSTIASRMDSKAEDKLKVVETNTCELNGLDAQLQDAFRDLAQADAQLETLREKQSKTEEFVNASQVADKEFKGRQKACMKDVQLFQKELKHFACVEEGLKPLLEGTCLSVEDEKKACDQFMKELEKLGTESALLVALPMVLEKKPEERKSFDLMVLDGVKDVLRKTMEAIELKLKNANEAADGVKQESDAHVAASIKLYSDLDDEIREVQLAEELRKDRAAAIVSLQNQAEGCSNLLASVAKTSEASKAERVKFMEVQDALEGLMSLAVSPDEADASSKAQN